MRDRSIFGETQCGQPVFTSSAGARTNKRTLCNGLFGAKLFQDETQCQKPGIGPDELSQSLS